MADGTAFFLRRGLSLSQGGGASYEAETTALVARFTTPPTDTRKGQINTLIKALKTAGIWTKLDAFYMMAAADSQAARRNWVQDVYNLSAVNSPTFTADRGYNSDGSSSYLNTGFNARTAPSALYVQNNGHLSLWNRTNQNVKGGYVMGAADSANTSALTMPGAGSACYDRISDLSGPFTNTHSDGFHTVSRTASNSLQAFRNAISLGINTTDAGGLPTQNPMYILGINFNGSPGLPVSDQFAQASIGSGLSAADTTAFYNAVNTYLQAVGAA